MPWPQPPLPHMLPHDFGAMQWPPQYAAPAAVPPPLPPLPPQQPQQPQQPQPPQPQPQQPQQQQSQQSQQPPPSPLVDDPEAALEAQACIATLQYLVREAVVSLGGVTPPEVDPTAATAVDAPAVGDAQARARHAAATAAVGKQAERLLVVLEGATQSQQQALEQAAAAVGADAGVGPALPVSWAQRGACERVQGALAAAEAAVRVACESESEHEGALRALEAARERLQAAQGKADAAPPSEDLTEVDVAEFNEVAAAATALKQAKHAVAQAAAALEARGIPPGVAVAKARAELAAAQAAVAGEATREAEVSDVLGREQRLAKLRALLARLTAAWRAADDAAGGRMHEADAAEAERDAACEAYPHATHESALARLAHIKRCRAALDEEEAAIVREYLRTATDQGLLVRAETLRREAVRAL